MSASVVNVEPDWEYPPVRLPNGKELAGEDVKQLIEWYWNSGQGREDLEADDVCDPDPD